MLGSHKWRVKYLKPDGEAYRIYNGDYDYITTRARAIAKRKGWYVSMVEEI